MMEGNDGTVISFHNISYSVDVKPNCCAKGQAKQILFNVNGVFKPGMNAILGATGSGKTSFLDLLAGRKDPKGLSGHVLVNGNRQPKNFKCMTGYVVQDDVVMGTLSVRENLMFSANMRLPKEVGRNEKAKRVNDTINELGLSAVADSKVGNQFIRGISGGERKRTNIGMELIVSPSLLFLDEPTSGLDANTAGAVLLVLSRISKNNRTIIFSIHQPRYSIYKLFDTLMFLAKGQIVYHGPAVAALDYFSSIGYECETHNNPPDFFLDIINGKTTALENEDPVQKDSGKIGKTTSLFEMENGNKVYQIEEGNSVDMIAAELSEQYQKSVCCQKVKEDMGPIFEQFEKSTRNGDETNVLPGDYANSFGTQLRYLSKRTILNLVRNPATSVLQVLVMIVLGVVAGILFLRQDDRLPEGLQNRAGLFFFCIMNMVFSNMGAIELFIKERVIYMHEHSNGFYRTSAYFTAKVLFDFIPLRVIPVAFYSSVIYFMTGLAEDAGKFFFFTLALILTSMTSAAVSFAAGASISIYAVANISIAMTFVLMMVFGGLLVNIESVWIGLRWLQYLSLFRYSNNALLINELKGLRFYQKNETSGRWEIESFAGELYMDTQNIDYETDWDKWVNIMALSIMTVGFLAIAYIQLRRLKTYK